MFWSPHYLQYIFRLALVIPAITNSYQTPEISEIPQFDITTWSKPVSSAMYCKNFKPKIFIDITTC